MPQEENEPAEIQNQVKEVRRNPVLNVAALGERLHLNKEDSTE